MTVFRIRTTARELADGHRLSWLESATATVHCNYIGGDEAWTCSVYTFDFSEEKHYHGPTLRAAIDAAIEGERPRNKPRIVSSRSVGL